MFSKACEYGIRAALYVVAQSENGQKISVKEISSEIGSPEAYTAKILQQLVRADIIQSIKGPYGGFFTNSAQAGSVSLADVVTAIDGKKIFTECGLGLKQCNAEKPCPLHSQFASIRENLKKMLDDTTLQSLAHGLASGQTVLRN